MLSFWFTSISFWWPLAFAIAFAIIAVIAVVATIARRAEEPRAGTIATLYGVGFGLAALSEFLMFLDLAYGLSLATAFSMTLGVVTFFAIAAVVIAVLAVGAAVLMQVSEEGAYRASHTLAR